MVREWPTADGPQFVLQINIYSKKIAASKKAIHFNIGLLEGNSYAQIGQTFFPASISIAQEGHSFFFINKDRKFPRLGKAVGMTKISPAFHQKLKLLAREGCYMIKPFDIFKPSQDK